MVRFSDLVGFPARQPEQKQQTSGVLKGRFKIQKSDDDKMLAFGWANVAVTAGGKQIEDYHDDMIDPEELEQAAYSFVELYREGGEMHERGGCAVLIESMVFTKQKMTALGIPDGTLPEGWFIGFKVTDPDVWDKVKDGTYSMFSIEGEAIREEVPEE
ncbi:MAG: XkdF-like putative serine protease domain-containing protein [Firmicutes bacterium]|nr:XkdF-like putative serine protease domain-containing protein [Bacillota bacterium]